MDPALLSQSLDDAAKAGKLPKAVIVVDLYGQCADLEPIVTACRKHGVYVIEDAAEALGATYGDRHAGAFGECAAFSFNGNKIMTTSGGGMLVSHRRDVIERARHLATQAREPVAHYEHTAIGFNYRLSNLLAAIGRGQLARLDAKLRRRRIVNAAYRAVLDRVAGVSFMPEAAYGRSNMWLTCVTIDSRRFGASREDVRLHLESENIETRPVWKPMHMQPVFRGCRSVGGKVAERLFATGLCLPSGSTLLAEQQSRVVHAFLDTPSTTIARRAVAHG